MTTQHVHVPRGRVPDEIPRQGGLADAGLTTEEDEAAMTGEDRGQLLTQEDLLTLPAHKDGRRMPQCVAGLPEVAVGHGEPRINAPLRRMVPHTCDGEGSRPAAVSRPSGERPAELARFFKFQILQAAPT